MFATSMKRYPRTLKCLDRVALSRKALARKETVVGEIPRCCQKRVFGATVNASGPHHKSACSYLVDTTVKTVNIVRHREVIMLGYLNRICNSGI